MFTLLVSPTSHSGRSLAVWQYPVLSTLVPSPLAPLRSLRAADAVADLQAEGTDVATESPAAKARMIVVGSASVHPLVGALLGSTTYKLVNRADVPVLVVPV